MGLISSSEGQKLGSVPFSDSGGILCLGGFGVVCCSLGVLGFFIVSAVDGMMVTLKMFWTFVFSPEFDCESIYVVMGCLLSFF